MSSKTAARVNASIREFNYSSVVGQYNSAEFEDGAGLIMVNTPWLDNPFYSEIVRVPDNSYGLAHSAVCHMLESANAPTVYPRAPTPMELRLSVLRGELGLRFPATSWSWVSTTPITLS